MRAKLAGCVLLGAVLGAGCAALTQVLRLSYGERPSWGWGPFGGVSGGDDAGVGDGASAATASAVGGGCSWFGYGLLAAVALAAVVTGLVLRRGRKRQAAKRKDGVR